MSVITKARINLTENLYQREKWIIKLEQMAKKELSSENYELFGEYNNEMIRLSHSKITRHKNLTHYVKLSQFYNGNWKNITERDIKRIVGIKYENEEYSFIDTVEDLGKKISKLGINIDAEEDYEICYKLKIHYKRYKKLRYTEEELKK